MKALTIIINAVFEQVEATIQGVEKFMQLPKADKVRLTLGYLMLGVFTAVYIGANLIKTYFRI